MNPSMRKVCGECGHMNPQDARYCNQCGKPVSSGAASLPYTPRHLSEKILRLRSSVEGERKQVSVLFVDVCGSVALSQQVEAEAWHAIMDRFFALLAEHVHRLEGTVNQYTGDGIMALFGAPLAHEDHAIRASRAALNIQADVRSLAAELKSQFGIDFAIRQGLNSGEVIVGRIGDDLRMDYTAKGQTVGLAARMEQQARPDTILISAFTRDLVVGQFELVERGSVSIKGFEHKIRTYELAGLGKVLPPEVEDIAPMVGREQELSLLAAYREQVQDQEQGLLVTISGDTGMGKSRLVREFVGRCQDQGVQVYGVRGSSHHRGEPLAPIRDLFASYCRLNLNDPPEQQLAQLDAVLGEFPHVPQAQIDNLRYILGHPGSADAEALDTVRRVDMALGLMLRLLRDGALNEHAVLVLENVQWLDDAHTRLYLDALIDMLAHLPLLVIMTARSDYVFRWQQQRCVRRLSLKPLDPGDAQAFLDYLVGENAALAELREAIVERAGGNPMFMAEVVEQLVSSGVLERDGRSFKLRRDPGEIQLPPSVQAVVAARIDALPESSKHVLQTAAVIGRRVSLSLLRAVYRGQDLDRALDELLKQGFFVQQHDAQTGPALMFTQPLFQSVAYEALLSDVRGELHRLIARAMRPEDSTDANHLAQAARHFAESGDAGAAVRWYLKSAEQAARVDLTEALRRLARARAQLVHREISPELRMQVLARSLQLGVRVGLGDDELQRLVDEAKLIAKQSLQLPEQLLYRLARCSLAITHHDPVAASAHLQKAEQLLQDDSPVELKLLLRVPAVYVAQSLEPLEPVRQQIDQALCWCQDDPEQGLQLLSYSPLVALTTMKGWLSLWAGQCAEAQALADQAVQGAERVSHGEQIAMALAAQAFIMTESGLASDAVARVRRSLELARQTKNRAVELVAQSVLGRALVKANQWAQAVATLQDALANLPHSGWALGETARMHADLSLAYLASGDARSARQAAGQAVRHAHVSGVFLALAEAELAQIRAGLMSSRPMHFLKRHETALQELQTRLEGRQVQLLQPEILLLWARVHWLRRDEAAARRHCEQAEALRLQQGSAQALIARMIETE